MSEKIKVFMSIVLVLTLVAALLGVVVPRLCKDVHSVVFAIPDRVGQFVRRFDGVRSSSSAIKGVLTDVIRRTDSFIRG